MSSEIDEQEQRSRNACLLIHGVNEDDGEETDTIVMDIINRELSIDMHLNGIQRSRRLGPRKTQRNTRAAKVKPRPIIVRFTDYLKRYEIFHSKRK